ncbi:hypothetical protein [Kiloniella antarctica]|uniref:Uncharacterized protein n=1 Tax=Kiloniella antarctica TaxID=1550907 RepID=A0ABW5BKV1_9PROT
MYLKLILSIFLAILFSSCDGENSILSKNWSENNANRCSEAGNYISFREQGIFYSNKVVEAMIFDQPRYVINDEGDLLIYPNHSELHTQSHRTVNKKIHFKLVQRDNRLSFDSFYLGENAITDKLDDQLENAVKLLDLVSCD